MQSTSPDQTVVPESERSAEPAPDTEAGGHGRGAWTTRPWYGRHRTWLKQQFAILLMNVVVAAVVVAAALLRLLDSGSTRVSPPELALKVFALWCLAFLPCWLYVRFLGQRAGALWEEYVLNLHRLGWDWPRFLPRPVETSHYFQEWSADGGRSEQAPEQNIYRKKFNAYYGRSVAENAAEENFRVRLDTLFPVVLTAAVLAVCWAAVLWDDGFLRAPSTFWDVLKFGFLGAYVFIVQMLLRRFFGSDLRPSAYTSALLRIIVVLVSGAALYQLLEIWLTGSGEARRWEAAVMFTIGFFPLVASQVLLRAAAAPLRFAMPSLKSDYPLSQLDGLNIWYEARLMEENIEDIQNLTTANLVDVILHTRAPVGRLVDWVDQAHLFLHLDRVEHGVKEARRARQPTPGTADPDAGKADSWTPVTPPGDATPSTDAQKLHRLVGTSVGPGSRGGTRTRTVLRQVGIRSATDLLKAFPPDQFDPLVADGNAAPQQQPIAQMLEDAGIDCGQLRLLVRVLSEEQGLAPVWNWNDRGVRARCPRRWPRSVRTCPISHADRAE
jgi:nitrate reductase NapE component